MIVRGGGSHFAPVTAALTPNLLPLPLSLGAAREHDHCDYPHFIDGKAEGKWCVKITQGQE